MKIKFSDGSICELLDTEGELLTVKDIKRRMAEAIIAIKDAEPLIENNQINESSDYDDNLGFSQFGKIKSQLEFGKPFKNAIDSYIKECKSKDIKPDATEIPSIKNYFIPSLDRSLEEIKNIYDTYDDKYNDIKNYDENETEPLKSFVLQIIKEISIANSILNGYNEKTDLPNKSKLKDKLYDYRDLFYEYLKKISDFRLKKSEEIKSKGNEFRNYLSELVAQNMHGAKTKPEHNFISIAEYLDSQDARELWSKTYPKEVMKSYSDGEDVESAFENHFVKPLVESIKANLIDEKLDMALPKNLKKFISYLDNIKERNFPSSLSGDVALKNAIYESFKMIENYIYKYLHSEYSNRSGIEYIPEDVSSNLSEWELSKLRRDYNTHSELIKKIDESDSLEEKNNYIEELKSKLDKNGSDE